MEENMEFEKNHFQKEINLKKKNYCNGCYLNKNYFVT